MATHILHTPTDGAYRAPTQAELTFAPPADETRIAQKPTPAQRARPRAAQRNREMANLRDDALTAKAVNGDHMARSLMGWL